ncbi:MAG TPA: hypothetical protein VE781_04080, partial [Kineosporiaceae bacterium]|nr:hypothetical protein [Kineosporiaceae bacterium]
LSFRLLVAVLVGGAASALGPPVGAVVVSLLGPLGDAVGRAVGADEARFGAMFAALLVLVVLAGTAGFALTGRTAGGPGVPDLAAAALNAAAPGVLLLGIGVLVLGVAPRATARVAYGLLAWSFLLEMLASAVDLPAVVRGTSLLHHVALAPAVPVHWAPVAAYLGLAVVTAAVGVRGLVRRDLSGE